MASELLIVSVLITARDLASHVFRRLALDAMTWQGAMTIGAVAVAGGIAAVGVESTRLAISFNQAMYKVAALSDMFQQSGYTMQWYQDQLLALAPQIDVAPVKLAQALYFVASAGFRGKQAIDILRYSAMAAAASMGDMQRIADLVTSAMNAYSQQGLTAGHATDVIMQAVVQGKVEMHALETSFAFVATTGLSAKFSIEEVAAAVSTLTRVSGNTAARRVQMDLDNLIRRLGDVAGIAKTARQLHMGFNEAQFASEGFIDRLKTLMQMTGFTANTLNDLRKQAHGNEQVFEQLALKAALSSHNFKELAGGAAAMIPAVILMKDQGGVFADILSKMGGQGEQTARAFNTMRQSTGQLLNMLRVTMESVGIQIGLHILPALNKVLPLLIQFGRGIIYWLQSTGGLNQLKFAILGIALVALPFLAAALFAILSGPVGMVTGAILLIVGAGILLGHIIQAVVAHFGGWDAILRRVHPLIVLVQKAFIEAGAAIRRALADPAIQAAWKQLQAALPGLLPILKAIAIVVGVALFVAFKVVEFAILAVLKVLPLLINWWAFLATALGDVAKAVMWVFDGKHWADLWNAIVKAAQQFGSAILNAILAPFRAIAGAFVWLYNHNYIFKALVDAVVAQFRRLWTAAVGIVQGLVTWLAQQWQNVSTAAQALWQQVVQHILMPIANAATALWTAVRKGLIDPLTSAITGVVTTALTWGENLVKQFIQGLLNQAGHLKDTVGGLMKSVAGFMGFHSPAKEGPGADADRWAPNLMRMYASGILAGIPQLASAANQAAQALAMGLLAGAAGGASISLAGMGGGGATNITHNWAGAFPGVTAAAEVEAVFNRFANQRERTTYRRTRRAGYGGGQRAGW